MRSRLPHRRHRRGQGSFDLMGEGRLALDYMGSEPDVVAGDLIVPTSAWRATTPPSWSSDTSRRSGPATTAWPIRPSSPPRRICPRLTQVFVVTDFDVVDLTGGELCCPRVTFVFKWLVYRTSATLLFFALQSLVLNHIRVLGPDPFLYSPCSPPLWPCTRAAAGARLRPGAGRGGATPCSTALSGVFSPFCSPPWPCLPPWWGRIFLSPGFFCCLFVSAAALLATGGMRILCTDSLRRRLSGPDGPDHRGGDPADPAACWW